MNPEPYISEQEKELLEDIQLRQRLKLEPMKVFCEQVMNYAE